MLCVCCVCVVCVRERERVSECVAKISTRTLLEKCDVNVLFHRKVGIQSTIFSIHPLGN